MDETNDPRVFFAAERTLLAWVRTGVAVIGLGFVVARFGLFLRLVRGGTVDGQQSGSTAIGVGLVLLGSVAVALAAWQQVRFCRALPPSALPATKLPNWSVWFAALLSVAGLLLGAYLLWQTPPA